MAQRIQLRRGTAAEWAAANPVLAVGEPGVETDTGKQKFGDGTSTWTALPYASKGDPGPAGIADDASVAQQVTGGTATKAALSSAYVPVAAKGAASGVASLDASQRPVEERVYVAQASRPTRPTIDSMLESFQAGHGWANLSGTAATVTDDTTDFALGTQSLKFTTKTDNSAASIRKTGVSYDLTGKQIVLWVKITGVADITEFLLYAGDSTLANNYSWTIADAGGIEQHVFREGQWQPLVLSFADGQPTGTPTRAAIATLQVRARATNGNSVTVNLGGLGVTAEPKAFPNGVISITCDDSYASQFNVLRPALDKYGWSATAYTIVDVIGTSGFMTLDQLKTLEQVSGWEVAGHAFTSQMHLDGYGSGSTPAAIEADIRSLRKWLLDNKFKGADHLAYPRGYFTADTQQIMGQYFATARTVTNRLSETLRPSDRMRLRSLSVTNTIPLSTAKKLVDNVKAGKGWGVITFHDIVTTPTVGAQWATADLIALLDYIKAAGIPVMNVSEVARRLNQVDSVKDTSNVVADANASMGAIIHAAMGNAPGRLNTINILNAGAGVATTSGKVDVTCFTPVVNMTITKLAAMTSGTAWTGHTVARMGLYTVDGAGALTLVAQTASDPTMFTAPNAVSQKVLDTAGGYPASYALVAGQRYALGIIGVGQTAGQLRAGSATSVLAQRGNVPGGTMGTGLTDLPTSGTVTVTGNCPWSELAA